MSALLQAEEGFAAAYFTYQHAGAPVPVYTERDLLLWIVRQRMAADSTLTRYGIEGDLMGELGQVRDANSRRIMPKKFPVRVFRCKPRNRTSYLGRLKPYFGQVRTDTDLQKWQENLRQRG